MNAPVSNRATDAAPGEAAGWSAQRLDQLYRHFALGLTAMESANLIGGVSANAVTCKRVRLGLCMRRTEPHSILASLLAARRVGHPVPPPSFPCEPLPDMDGPPPPGARPARLVDRRRGQCAWPLGPAMAAADHASLFCCAPTPGRRSYCEAHDALSRRRP